jgi:hypothetical protein
VREVSGDVVPHENLRSVARSQIIQTANSASVFSI